MNGTEEYCTYDANGLLLEQKDVVVDAAEGEKELTRYNYEYDSKGNISSIVGSETHEAIQGLGNLKNATFEYDAENRLIRYNDKDVIYDADGNMTYGPVDGEMSELVYDCRNRLVSAGLVKYTYDVENNRISAQSESYLEKYVVDTVSSPLSRVLEMTRYDMKDGRISGTGVDTYYIYGKGLIYEHVNDEFRLYHHYNHLGSTTKLTDDDAEVIETYAYGTYGELLSGDTKYTRYLYNGRLGVSTDSNGLYYMRQGYYNPEIKRFINQDIVRGDIGNSQSLNRYSYVQGNPVNATDPFGLSPLSYLMAPSLPTKIPNLYLQDHLMVLITHLQWKIKLSFLLCNC